MRSLLVLMLVVGGCVESADELSRAPTIEVIRDSAAAEPAEADLCAIAELLDSDDVCSLMCDPAGMADFLIAGGMEGGKCVQLRCELPGAAAVLVGVCLPP